MSAYYPPFLSKNNIPYTSAGNQSNVATKSQYSIWYWANGWFLFKSVNTKPLSNQTISISNP